MGMIDLQRLERELKKRLAYPYSWGRKQSDSWDRETHFIYEIRLFSQLEERISTLSPELRNYALNRWLNFWSAKGIEQIFTIHPNVVACQNEYDKTVDFYINNIPFDHKTSVFPKGFQKDISYALEHKRDLIEWLYKEQSQQGRLHFKNRLFVVLYDKESNEHWKLKAEISLIKQKIDNYINCTFPFEKFHFGKDEILSDIIWIIK